MAEIDAKSMEYMSAAAPNHPDLDKVATEVVHARAQLRIVETMLASIEARITMSERALSAAVTREPNPYRLKTMEQTLDRLKDEKQQRELRRDHCQAKVDAALSRSAGLRDPSDEAAQKVSIESHRDEAETRKLRKIPLSKVTYTSGTKRVIAMLLSITPDASDLEICRHFDADGMIDLPKTWTTGKNRSFEVAYKDPQHRRKIEKMISKVRTDLRRKGFIK